MNEIPFSDLPGWENEYPGSITVCDTKGIILLMNDQAAETFRDFGGKKIIGTNLLECHHPASRKKLEDLMQSQQRNIYTVEKNGKRKMVYQCPWYKQGKYAGFVELSFEVPLEIPVITR